MDATTVYQLIVNLRDPLNYTKRIHFTARAMKLLVDVFTGKSISEIDLHCILLYLAQNTNLFNEGTEEGTKYISLKDVAVYLSIRRPECVSVHEFYNIAMSFDPAKDNEHNEVSEMLEYVHLFK